MYGFIDTKQAAKELGVNASRVRQMILAGKLKAVKFGRDWMIRFEDLDPVRVRMIGRPWPSRLVQHAKA